MGKRPCRKLREARAKNGAWCRATQPQNRTTFTITHDSTKIDSSESAANAYKACFDEDNCVTISSREQLPSRSQITFGGCPYSTLRCWKSESLETIINLGCLGRAIHHADEMLSGVMNKARVWEKINADPVNERQRKVINRLLDGFEGKLTSSKYAKLAKCSEDTALRDINALVDRGVMVKNEAGGRSTSYSLCDEPQTSATKNRTVE